MGKNSTNIAIFGAGYVGLTSAVLFANSGFKVQLVEIDKAKLESLQSGIPFFYEHGVQELLKQALSDNSLVATNDAEKALKDADVVFSCVGTPDNPDGSSNLSYVFKVASTVAELSDNIKFVQKSTVPVQTGSKIEQLFKDNKKSIDYVANPEFLREGTAIQDSLWFDRVVVGGSNKIANNKILNIYRQTEENREKMEKISKLNISKQTKGKYISTDRNSAELIKVTANAFLALKISFANSIAKLADEAGADIVDVMDAVGSDKRIGRAFLDAGRGYGGGCFPKDVSGLIASASEHGVNMPIMVAATRVNESMPGYIAEKAKKILGSLKDKKVTVLGLSFKAGTSDARKSPGVKLANILERAGAKVSAYDPYANSEAKKELRSNITVGKSTIEALKGTEAVFIATEWPEFIKMDLSKVVATMDGILFFDAVNAFDTSKINEAGLKYYGVGKR